MKYNDDMKRAEALKRMLKPGEQADADGKIAFGQCKTEFLSKIMLITSEVCFTICPEQTRTAEWVAKSMVALGFIQKSDRTLELLQDVLYQLTTVDVLTKEPCGGYRLTEIGIEFGSLYIQLHPEIVLRVMLGDPLDDNHNNSQE
jgi:hypothetical protein